MISGFLDLSEPLFMDLNTPKYFKQSKKWNWSFVGDMLFLQKNVIGVFGKMKFGKVWGVNKIAKHLLDGSETIGFNDGFE